MNFKFNVLVLVFALTTVVALADSPASLSVTPVSNSSVYTVCYKTRETGKVKISVYSNTNQLIFSEVLTNVASFSRPYNFSQLAEGEYTIVLEDKNGQQVEKVSYFTNKIKSSIKVAEVANQENKYLLNVTSTGTEEVYVKIYGDDNVLLHEQTVEVNNNFGLIYNLSPVRSTVSKVTFEISTNSGAVEVVTF